MDQTKPIYEQACIVELLGHRRLFAHIRDTELGGQRVLLLTIPLPGGRAVTQTYPMASVFCLTETTAEHVESDKTRRYNESFLAGADLLGPEDRALYLIRVEAEREAVRVQWEREHPSHPNPYEERLEEDDEENHL